MVSTWFIDWIYDKYVEMFADSGMIDVDGQDGSKSTQHMIQEGEDLGFASLDLSINNSNQFLIYGDNNLPDIGWFPLELLCWLPIGLTRILQIQVTEDHEQYWWYTYAFVKAYNEEVDLFPDDLINNYELLIRLVTSEAGPQKENMFDNSSLKILRNSKVLATYLGYPTLEGFVKNACRNDIKMNGEIRRGKRVRKLGPPSKRAYYRSGPQNGICSNLGALLWHFETEVARAEHSVRMSQMRDEVAELYGTNSSHVYGLLNEHRNDSLHGRRQGDTERGMILNFCSMIIWMTLLP